VLSIGNIPYQPHRFCLFARGWKMRSFHHHYNEFGYESIGSHCVYRLIFTTFQRRIEMKPEKLLKFIITAALSFTLFGCQPDLKIDSLTHTPKSPTTADTITFVARVKNVGFKEAGPSTLGLKVGGETYPATYPVPSLGRNETHTVKRQLTLSVAQRYRNTATADLKNEVHESNENNNQKTEDYVVMTP